MIYKFCTIWEVQIKPICSAASKHNLWQSHGCTHSTPSVNHMLCNKTHYSKWEQYDTVNCNCSVCRIRMTSPLMHSISVQLCKTLTSLSWGSIPARSYGGRWYWLKMPILMQPALSRTHYTQGSFFHKGQTITRLFITRKNTHKWHDCGAHFSKREDNSLTVWASMKCQPQYSQGLILTVFTPLPRANSKHVSFKEASSYSLKFTITYHRPSLLHFNFLGEARTCHNNRR